MKSREAIINIRAAPDMIVSMVYPPFGNEEAIGLKLAGNEAQRQAAIAAKHSEEIVLAGPVQIGDEDSVFGKMAVNTVDEYGQSNSGACNNPHRHGCPVGKSRHR